MSNAETFSRATTSYFLFYFIFYYLYFRKKTKNIKFITKYTNLGYLRSIR